MGKKKIVPTNDIEVTEADLPVAPTPEELDMLQVHLADVDLKFGDGREYSRERIVGEAQTYLRQSADAMFEAGKRLILLKEHEPHGEFMNSLNSIGIEYRTAKNMMSATSKFLDENGNPKLKSISTLPITKLYSLAQLEDEDIEDLAENGEIEGFTIDEAQKLTSRELKKKISELKARNKQLEEQHQQEIEIKDQLLEDKNKKIDELDGRLRMESDSSRWGEKAMEQLKQLQILVPCFSEPISKLNKLIDEIDEYQAGEYEQAKMILIEQARWLGDVLQQDMDRTLFRLRHLHPDANSIFHDLNDLTVVTGLRDGVVEEAENV